MAIRAKWIGRRPDEPGFEYLNGIPARDLTDEEYQVLSGDDKRDLRASGLYEVATEKAVAQAEPAPESKAATKRKGD